MTEQRQQVWDALLRIRKQRDKNPDAVAWPPRLPSIAEEADVPLGTVQNVMTVFHFYGVVDYIPGNRLVILREPAEAVKQ